MLYLEDYLEMIEHLPSELRDRFTDMREMDLSVQNSVDTLEERQKVFFANCRKMKGPERDEEYEKIKKEFNKVIEDSNEKVLISEESYGLVDRYLRKLDHELHKFKMELEADNRGITEILEKHSLELDLPANTALKENRHPKKHSRKHHTTTHHGGAGLLKTERGRPLVNDNLSLDSMSTCSSSSANVGMNSVVSGLGTPGQSGQGVFSALQQFGVGANPLAAAASQAIAATQQLTGRRTSSLKASFEAINLGLQTHEFALGRDLVGLAGSSGDAILSSPSTPSGSATQKRKKSHSRTPSTSLVSAPPLLDVVSGGADTLLSSADDLLGAEPGPETNEQDWNYDPSEPRYCMCNQISYGDMVACDNEECPYEWFHYPCVGITAPPKGKWYCPACSATMARRKGRK